MAFKPGAFALGFLERKEEYQSERREEISDLLKISFADALDRARVNRKERKAKKEALSSIGSSLTSLGLSDAQAASILAMGPDGAKTELARLQDAAGKGFDVTTAVTAAGDANITISDAIAQLLGETQAVDQADRVIETGGGMFEPDAKFQQSVIQELAKAYGEDPDRLFAEARGYTTGDLLKPGVIDYKAIGEAKSDIEQLDYEIKQEQKNKLKAEILELGGIDWTKERGRSSMLRQFKATFSPYVAGILKTELSYTDQYGYNQGEKLNDLQLKAQGVVDRLSADALDALERNNGDLNEVNKTFINNIESRIQNYVVGDTKGLSDKGEKDNNVVTTSTGAEIDLTKIPKMNYVISTGIAKIFGGRAGEEKQVTDEEHNHVLDFIRQPTVADMEYQVEFQNSLQKYLEKQGVANSYLIAQKYADEIYE